MVKYSIVPTTSEHIAELSQTMRDDDRREVWAACRHTPLTALDNCIGVTEKSYTGLANGEVICIFGIGQRSFVSDWVQPWLLGSTNLPRHAKMFLRLNKSMWEFMRKDYPRQRNYVDTRNKTAIRWLRWLGFEIKEAVPYGPDGVLFHPFVWEASGD